MVHRLSTVASFGCAVVAMAGRASADAQAEPARDAVTPGDHAASRVGAVVGIGFPIALSLEGILKVGGVVSVGAEYGVLPRVTVAGVQTAMRSLAGDVRLFAFARAPFFVGARAGYQRVDAATTLTVTTLGSFSESLRVETFFVNPRAGFLWTMRSGFTIGMDAGIELPVSTSLSSTYPQALAQDAGATGAIRTLGGVIPTIDLLQAGMLF